MFSLIITIISIALVAALALATIYYGGSAFNRGSADARAAQYINEGQQINGAFAMAKADAQAGTYTGALAALSDLVTGKYLAQAPAGWTIGTGDYANAVVRVTTSAPSNEVCDSVVAKGGTADATGQYGCVKGATAAENVMFYKF